MMLKVQSWKYFFELILLMARGKECEWATCCSYYSSGSISGPTTQLFLFLRLIEKEVIHVCDPEYYNE